MDLQIIKRLTVLILVLALGGQVDVVAQDIHFSQFYASPLTLNPALTGRVPGRFRISGIYRSQWGGIPGVSGPTYGTPAGSFDLPILVGKKKMDAVGLGVVVDHDFSNSGGYKTLGAMLSVSYIKSLGKGGKHQLSIGLQGGVKQSKTGTFRFADQYNQAEFDENLTSVDEGLNDQSKIMPDFQAGLFYNGRVTKKATIYAGFSMFHLFEPKEEFTDGSNSVLPRRYVAHAGAEWDFAKRFTMYPGLIYMNQAGSSELNLGTNFGWHFINDPAKTATLYLGGWYRLKDAFIAMVGVEYKQVRLGFSYDTRLKHGTALSNANTRGAFEVSLLYIGNFSSISDNNVFLFCPRF